MPADRRGPRRPAARRQRPAAVLLYRLAAVLLLALVGGPALAAPAAAHVEPVSTAPADGARLATAPAEVTVSFDGAVRLDDGGSMRLLRAGRELVPTAPPGHPGEDPALIALPLPAGLPTGSYTVAYAVVSIDGHRVTGMLSFVVGDGPLIGHTGLPAGDLRADPGVQTLVTLARWVGFAGLALLGGLPFLLLCWPAGRADPAARRILALGAVSVAAATVALLVLYGPYAAGRGPAAVLDPSLLAGTAGLPAGRALLLRLGALAALVPSAVLLLRPAEALSERARARVEMAAVVVAVLLLAGFAGSGHAGSGVSPTATVVSTTVHLAATAGWVGGLLMLAVVLLRRPVGTELGAVLRSFSGYAATAVGLLALTGAFQAWQGLGTWAALWSTPYGRLLAIKLALVAALLAGAAVARHRLWRRPEAELHRLRRTVTVEVALAAAVLAVTAALVAGEPPARPAQTAGALPVEHPAAPAVPASG